MKGGTHETIREEGKRDKKRGEFSEIIAFYLTFFQKNDNLFSLQLKVLRSNYTFKLTKQYRNNFRNNYQKHKGQTSISTYRHLRGSV